jgi:hypothetical protein
MLIGLSEDIVVETMGSTTTPDILRECFPSHRFEYRLFWCIEPLRLEPFHQRFFIK